MSILDNPVFRTPRIFVENVNEELFAQVIAACQRLHRQGLPIVPDTLCSELPSLPTVTAEGLLGAERTAEALAARGINFSPLDQLTAKQMAAASIYLDTSSSMSHPQRLKAAGVTQAQWDGWMNNPRFNALIFQMSEDRLAASVPNAHLALLKAVDEGKPWAIKMFYEISGRHNPAAVGDDPKALFAHMLQILDDSGVPVDVMRKVGEKMVALSQTGAAPAPQPQRQAMIMPESGRGPL